MKIAEKFNQAKTWPRNRKGIALLTVLTVMALTTILVLTFFSLATSEHKASNTYSHGIQAHQVAEQAVNMVIAQIREATTVGTERAWASQPGAIRVWDSTGSLENVYKLYSDDLMKSPSNTEIALDFTELDGWSDKPAHFVDLNEPVIRGERVFYPIVHPNATHLPEWPQPLGDDQDGIEGFSINRYDYALNDEGIVGAKAAGVISAEDGHIAMPVRWIYQLADGTLGTLVESGTGVGEDGHEFRTISGAGTPSRDNPMVARFAYWADDETAKLNLNVHAGGLAWDVPKAGGEMDMSMGKFQPAQHEWQRYPGHPATTHLVPALAPGVIDIVNDREAMEMLYNVVPRIVGGGSESGTRLIDTRNPAEENGLVADKEPLFPSLDDMIMRSDRELHEFPDANGKALPEKELSDYLERSKFFITVSSRAPETNMLNKPRVAIWPIHNTDYDSDDYQRYLTPFDRLIHYCASMGESSTGGYPRWQYIFKREQADSAGHDIGLPSNDRVYNYLDQLMQEVMPGYGASFSGKYGKEQQQQILTEIFDYIRTTNLHDDTLFSQDFAEAFQDENTDDHLTFTNPRDNTQFNRGFGHKGHGQVTPSIRGDTKGMGRFFSIAGADILVAGVGAERSVPGSLHPRYPGVTSYRGQNNEPPGTEMAFTNLPPLPESVANGGQGGPTTGWPQWLVELKTEANDMGGIAQQEFDAAFDKTQWNWQLAMIDPGYANSVRASPTDYKFRQDYITVAVCQNARLQRGERLVQASFLFNIFCPSIGWGGINPDMEIHIKARSGMAFQGGAYKFLGFDPNFTNPSSGNSDTFIFATNWTKPHREGGVRAWGGLLPFTYLLQGRDVLSERGHGNDSTVWWNLWGRGGSNKFTTSLGIRSRFTPLDRGYDKIEDALKDVAKNRDIGGDPKKLAQAYMYDLVTIPFKIGAADPIAFGGGKVEFKVYDGGEYTENSAQDDGGTADLVQTVEMDFPPFSFDNAAVRVSPGVTGYVNEFDALSSDSAGVLEIASVTADPANPWDTKEHSARMRPPWNTGGGDDSAVSFIEASGTPRNLDIRGRMGEAAWWWNGRYIHGGDIVQSISIPHGDARIAASREVIDDGDGIFEPHRDWGKVAMAHSLTNANGQRMVGFNLSGNAKDYLIIPDLPGNNPYRNAVPLPMGGGTNGRSTSENVQLYGDFDNGAGTMIDGPYINKPDEGNVHALKTKFMQEVVNYWEQRRNYGDWPYFSNPEKAEAGGPAYFSPNRLVSGPGVFGSLPTGSVDNIPWRTLLFRPDVAGNGYAGDHIGAQDPPDHLIMDLFWMPIVEPYAISEPLSTAGKVNLNYEIAPFLHIERNTALRGVLRSEYMVCIPNEYHDDYKHGRGRGAGWHWRDNPYGGKLQGIRLRSVIVESVDGDDNDVFDQFRERFDGGSDLFKSATEICTIHLIPEELSSRMGSTRGSIGTYTPSVDEMENGKYWRDHSLVGDNSRERPYANIQNRITTKSNTFQVHYRAQVIKQARRASSGEYSQWRPEFDTVQAEYRGSSIVERYVNPNDPDIPDFEQDQDATLDEFYRFRIVNPKRFAP